MGKEIGKISDIKIIYFQSAVLTSHRDFDDVTTIMLAFQVPTFERENKTRYCKDDSVNKTWNQQKLVSRRTADKSCQHSIGISTNKDSTSSYYISAVCINR